MSEQKPSKKTRKRRQKKKPLPEAVPPSEITPQNVKKEVKPSKEELRARLREKIRNKGVHRMSKSQKEDVVNEQCSKLGVSREDLEKFMKIYKNNLSLQ